MEPISRDQLQSVVAEARERFAVPGMVVGVWADGAEVVVADGVRELGHDRRVAPETVFRIASITKPFVATLAMTLADAGLLALDEPPPGTRAQATVRQLLGNVGGLASDWDDRPDFGDGDGALERLAERPPPLLPIEPGMIFSYANSGFWLVGAACAAVARTTFEQAMQERVLAPLALASTAFEASEIATGHELGEPLDDRYPRARRPSGGLWSTVGDLLRFARHHLGAAGPLSTASRTEMRRPLSSGPGFDYGLGWFLTSRGGRRVVEHAGSAFGYQSHLLLVPDGGVSVAALTNSSRGSHAIEEVRTALGLSRDLPETCSLAGGFERFSGTYRGFGFEVEVRPDPGGLVVDYTETSSTGRVTAYPPARARPIGEREFELVEGDDRGDGFDFPRDGLVRFTAIGIRDE
jgi:CubicO group peptidase (beta-lactamase class C family)